MVDAYVQLFMILILSSSQKDANSEEKSVEREIKQFYQLGYNYYWIQRYVQSLTTAVQHQIFYNIIPVPVFPEVHK